MIIILKLKFEWSVTHVSALLGEPTKFICDTYSVPYEYVQECGQRQSFFVFKVTIWDY